MDEDLTKLSLMELARRYAHDQEVHWVDEYVSNADMNTADLDALKVMDEFMRRDKEVAILRYEHELLTRRNAILEQQENERIVAISKAARGSNQP